MRWMTLVLTLVAALVVVVWLRSDSTIYAPGYSWSKFSSIQNGMTPEDVTRILGQPLSVEPFDGEHNWVYGGLAESPAQFVPLGGPIAAPPSVEANFAANWSGKIIRVHHDGANDEADTMVGKSLDDLRTRYGAPTTAYTIPRQTMYWYSKLRNIKGEYIMLIHFGEDGKVYQIDASRIGHYCGTPGQMPRASSLLQWLEWYVL